MKGFSDRWLRVFFFSLMISLFCLILPGPLIAQEYGSISGTVYDSDGETPFDQPVSIQVIQGDPCEHWETVSQGTINPASGEFTVFGVPAGQYFLRIGNTGSTNAVENWWFSTGGSIQCRAAEQISLSADQELTDLAVITEHAGSISGTVTESDGGKPVENIHIYVEADACRGGWLSGANTDENGNYTLMGIPAGTVYVKTWTGGSDPAFVNQTYDGDTGTLDCEQAQGVPVIAGETTTEIDFQLDTGVTISGRVTDTLGNPIPNLWVHAFDDLCGGNGLGGGRTDDQGYYTTAGLPPGDVYIEACPDCDNLNYVNSWWTGSGNPGATDCGDAQNLNIQAGVDATDIDFQLAQTATLSGTVFEMDGTTTFDQPGHIYLTQGDPCHHTQYHRGIDISPETGEFTIEGITPGSYYIRIDNTEGTNLVERWWNSTGGSADCQEAESIDLSVGQHFEGLTMNTQAGAVLSGTVYESDGITPIQGLRVFARVSACDGQWFGNMDTDENGNYTISGLPGGTVFVGTCGTCNENNLLFVDATWDGDTGSQDCNQGIGVEVTAGETTAGIDFHLEAGVTISGRVTDTSGNPIPDLWLHAFDNACGGRWLGGGTTNEQGYYTTAAMPTGDVFIEACPGCHDQNYVNNWWTGADTPGSKRCEDAQNLNLQAGVNAEEIDFILNPAGSITGRVTESDGITPIPDLHVYVNDDGCNSNWGMGRNTDENGYYTIPGIPAGTVNVRACPSCSGHSHTNEWYDGEDGTGSEDCNQAIDVSVTAGATTEGIDFALEYPIFVEIIMSQRPEDTFNTWYGIYFFDFDNFDIDSVVSITMSGPSGSPVYNYTREEGDDDDFVKNQWNGFHVSAPGVQPEVGTYTFAVVTDDFSTTVTHIRRENITLPLVDAGTMSPTDGSEITSTVPVFEWGGIENPPMPVYYRLQVYDDTGYQIYASQRKAGLRSVALPEPLFDPGRTYSWHVSVYDTYDGNLVENASHTQSYTFTIADTTSNSHASPPAIDLNGWGTLSWRRSNTDATYMSIKVIDHDGIAYDGSSHQVSATLNGETYSLYHVRSDSAYEAYYEYWDADNPAPAGDYIFTATDPEGNTGSLTDTVVVNQLPIFDENTFDMIPSGTSPTLRWDALPGAVRYRIRIYDNNWNIIFQGYPRTQLDMTYTLPPGILQPDSHYYYRIEAWDSHSSFDTDNGSASGNIAFTTGEESVDPLVEIGTYSGAATRNSGDQGTYLNFWVKIHDARGVPENIESVTATFPDGATIPLELDYNESSTCGIYYAEDFGLPIASGDYTITVENLDGNTHSVTDTLDVNPIGYPDDTTVNAVVDGTRVDVTWEGIDEAAFYRVEINDMDGNRLHNLSTTQNAYTIPAGYLKENSYQYRITTWREFFDQGINNSSQSVMKTFEIGSTEPDQQIPRQVLSGQDQALDVPADAKIIGTGARETLNILMNVSASFTAGNGDRINLPWNRSDYTLTSTGNRLYLDEDSGCRVTLIVNGTSTVAFADGEEVELKMLFEPGVPPMVILGENVIGN
jgi:hypothetical protein